MAEIYTDDSVSTATPGAYASYKVQQSLSGLSSTGVLMLVGEAEEGPSFSEETKLSNNGFGPDQFGEVQAKYGSGRLVDAFLESCTPANDIDITGAPQRMVLVKTNTGTKASAVLAAFSGSYGSIFARKAGTPANNSLYQVTTNTAEVLPTTGSFTYIPVMGDINASFVSNGVTANTTFAANLTSIAVTPTVFVSQVAALAGVIATGGVNRNSVVATNTLALVATGNNITLTQGIAWGTTPSVGDTLTIPTGSSLSGTGTENNGAYVVTAVTSTTATATKLSNAGNGTSAPGAAVVAPSNDSVGSAVVTDAIFYSPVTISLESGDPLNGIGKSLEIAQASGSGTDLLNRTAFNLGTTTPVTWLSTSGSPKLLTGTEYKATFTVSNNPASVNESFTTGGEIALRLGYTGTSATFTLTDTTFSTTVVGGSGTSISSTLLSAYPTINDLVSFLNSKTGYTASVGSAALGNLPPSAIDNVTTADIMTVNGSATGRFKIDAYRFFNAMATQTTLTQFGSATVPVQADSGLPAPMTAAAFLSGGLKGATTDANVLAALAALEKVTGNFVVPLFSRDATADIADGLTDSGSTYTIASINANARTHVRAMSTVKKKKNRQAFVSLSDTFTNQKEAATGLSSERVAMAFQDQLVPDSTGSITQQQPWMGGVIAAGMQAAGLYRSILNKGANTNGFIQEDGSFDSDDDTQLEEAILAGLLPMRQDADGRMIWATDGTTYGKDSNFVFNSIQAVYAADTVALTLVQKLERAFLGQSTADITPTIALVALDGVMGELLRSKLVAPSEGPGTAKKGYADAKVRIVGSVLKFSLKVYLATALKFIKIDFEVAPVTGSAGV